MISVMAIAGGVFMLFIFLWMSINLYRKCGVNQAMIISGWGTAMNGRAFKIIVGGGDVVLPMLQQVNYLSLEVMSIELDNQAPIIMNDGAAVLVSAVAQVKVRADDVSITTAAEQFIGKSEEEIANLARQILVGGMRSVLGKITVAELVSSLDKVAIEFQECVQPQLAKLGLTCVAFSIGEIKDNGYLESHVRTQNEDAQKLANEYEQVLPLLETTLGEQSLVFQDLLSRYATVLAGRKDAISLAKAEELKVRAGKQMGP